MNAECFESSTTDNSFIYMTYPFDSNVYVSEILVHSCENMFLSAQNKYVTKSNSNDCNVLVCTIVEYICYHLDKCNTITQRAREKSDGNTCSEWFPFAIECILVHQSQSADKCNVHIRL